jgi:hypothetical protein
MTEDCCKRNFFESVVDTAARLVRDPKMASDDLREARLAVCKDCEHNDGGRCRLCGCFILPKSHFQSMECPDNRWPKV